MPVTDIARSKVVSVTPDASIASVAETMRTESVGCVVVVDAGEPIGLVSDRDLAMLVLGGETDPESTAVEAILDEEVVTVTAETGVYELLEVMSERGVRRLPVVSDGDLVGIVSLSDVVVLLGMELQQVANVIRTVSPAYERLATELSD